MARQRSTPEPEPAENGEPGVSAQVTQAVPRFEVEVLPGQQLSPAGEDVMLEEGGRAVLDGPTAMNLASLGHVKIIGVAEGESE
jgi:hypothetical protein